MANKVLLKKSSVASKVPSSSDLDYGEVALNYTDGKLYYKNSSNVIKSFLDQEGIDSSLSLKANTADLATVAITGSYTDLTDKPTFKTINGQSIIGSGDIQIEGGTGGTSIVIQDSEQLTGTSADQVIDTYDKTIYRTVKYLVQAIDSNQVHATEVTLTHNDVDVFISEYGTMYTGDSPLISVAADIDGSSVYLKATPSSDSVIVDFTRISIIARVFPSGDMDLMTLTGTEDLMTSSGSLDFNN